MASTCEHRITLGEVAAAAGWPDNQLGEVAAEAERLRVAVEPDWADRLSVRVQDAATLYRRLLTHTLIDAAQAAAQRADESAWSPPPVRDKDGKLVAALELPGQDQNTLGWSDAPW